MLSREFGKLVPYLWKKGWLWCCAKGFCGRAKGVVVGEICVVFVVVIRFRLKAAARMVWIESATVSLG